MKDWAFKVVKSLAIFYTILLLIIKTCNKLNYIAFVYRAFLCRRNKMNLQIIYDLLSCIILGIIADFIIN